MPTDRTPAARAAWLALLLAGCSPSAPPSPDAATAGAMPGATTPAAPAAATPAAPAAAPDVVPPWLAALRAMDADGDGRISAAEHAAAARRMFAAMDRDGDGRVDLAELAARRGTTPERTAAALDAVDRDHDGGLDADEHAASTRAAFDAMDADHDGALTAAELQGAR
ncbi:MAG: EF-hand domain-containing protein [Lysobacteraceae bacterium]